MDREAAEQASIRPRQVCHQFGAGNGKTFTILMLLGAQNDYRGDNATRAKIEALRTQLEVQRKKTVVYLTKMNSAKDVLVSELMSLQAQGRLCLPLVRSSRDAFQKRDASLLKNQNQYEINLKGSRRVIIGTVDSFFFGVAAKSGTMPRGSLDFFGDLARGIAGNSQALLASYRRSQLDKDALVVIDEAQDLDRSYSLALHKLQRDSCFDIFLVGDYLQSIWKQENAMQEFPAESGQNVVRRFKNRKLKDFVNAVVRFERFSDNMVLPIQDIDASSEYEGSLPKVFKMPQSGESTAPAMSLILQAVAQEADQHGYHPRDFMFISPIIANNAFLSQLQMELQQFWSARTGNPDFLHVHLHHSEENQAIDLQSSRDSSQILSIHSAKGSGRNVVFLLCLDQRSLEVFARGNVLVYESLLHIAVTRQHRSLYVGFACEQDDISRRLQRALRSGLCQLVEDGVGGVAESAASLLSKISKTFSARHLEQYIAGRYLARDGAVCAALDAVLAFFGPYSPFAPCADTNTNANTNAAPTRQTVDFLHHKVRQHSLSFQIMNALNSIEYLVRRRTSGKVSLLCTGQFYACLKQVENAEVIVAKNTAEYEQIMRRAGNDSLVMVDFGTEQHHHKLCASICRIIKHIQHKISKNSRVFCQLENVVIIFCVNQLMHRMRSRMPIMELYQVVYVFLQQFSVVSSPRAHRFLGFDAKHEECVCRAESENFAEPARKPQLHIVEFYEKLDQFHRKAGPDGEDQPGLIHQYLQRAGAIESAEDPLVYNNFHQVPLLYRGQFRATNMHDLVGYNSKAVIQQIIKSQYNKLNFYQTVVQIVVRQYILQHVRDEKNQAKFVGKQIYTGIFALDNDYKMTAIPAHLVDAFEPFIDEFLAEKYKNANKAFVRAFSRAPSLRVFHQMLGAKRNLPEYMKDTFSAVMSQRDCFQSEEELCEHLNRELDKRVDTIFA